MVVILPASGGQKYIYIYTIGKHCACISHIYTFPLEVGEHVDIFAGLEHGGPPWNQRVDEPPALEEGGWLALDPVVVPEHTESVHVFKLSDVVLLVNLEQTYTCT